MTRETRESNADWPEWMHYAWNVEPGAEGSLYPLNYPNSDGKDQLCIGTLEGIHAVSWGDYIIQGVNGEIYPCKPDIFEKTYDLVEVPAMKHTDHRKGYN
jgi:hypothetical protein